MAISEIKSDIELDCVCGGMNAWGFAGAVLAIGAGAIAVATAPVWGAVGGVLAIGAVGANAIASYSSGGGGGAASANIKGMELSLNPSD